MAATNRQRAILRFPHVELRRAPSGGAGRNTAPRPAPIVSPCAEPPDGEGWLHEIKHNGHRLLAIIAGGELRLVTRNGYDRTELFRLPFDKLCAAGLPAVVLDGEIAVPDERGVTHIDLLTDALRQRRHERLAYFAFDLLHLDGHDLRCCAIEDRKAVLTLSAPHGASASCLSITWPAKALPSSRRCCAR